MVRKTSTTSSLSYQEQQEKRKPYRDVIHQWKLELGLYEKNNAKRIEEAAFTLWETGTVDPKEKHKICSMILHDLREEIIAHKISEYLIYHYCPKQFKGAQGPKAPWKDRHRNFGIKISEQTLPDVTGRVVEVLSGTDLFMTKRTPIENVIQESEGHLVSIPISWSGDDMYVTEENCTYLIPLLRRFKEVLNNARKMKRTKAEMESR